MLGCAIQCTFLFTKWTLMAMNLNFRGDFPFYASIQICKLMHHHKIDSFHSFQCSYWRKRKERLGKEEEEGDSFTFDSSSKSKLIWPGWLRLEEQPPPRLTSHLLSSLLLSNEAVNTIHIIKVKTCWIWLEQQQLPCHSGWQCTVVVLCVPTTL